MTRLLRRNVIFGRGVVVLLVSVLFGNLVFAVDEGDSAREAELASARLQLEHAKAALFEARKNLALLMEEHGSDYPQEGFLGLLMMPAKNDGVRVVRVLPDAPAAAAGISSGDLITAINGQMLPDSLDREAVLHNAYDALADIKPGETVAMTVKRGDRRFNVALTAAVRKGTMYCDGGDGCRPFRHEPVAPFTGLSSHYDGPDLSAVMPTITSNPERAASTLPFLEQYGYLAGGLPKQVVRGLELAELNSGLGSYFGVSQGVLVVNVLPGGLPGIEQGDVIVACGERVVSSPRQLMHMLMSFEQGDEIQLKVMRQFRLASIAVQLPPALAGASR